MFRQSADVAGYWLAWRDNLAGLKGLRQTGCVDPYCSGNWQVFSHSSRAALVFRHKPDRLLAKNRTTHLFPTMLLKCLTIHMRIIIICE
jgi:hypothetical protein